jgi:hypothetical protein
MNESQEYSWFEIMGLIAFSSVCILGVYIVAWKPFVTPNLEGLIDNKICNASQIDCDCLVAQNYDPEPLSNFGLEDRI